MNAYNLLTDLTYTPTDTPKLISLLMEYGHDTESANEWLEKYGVTGYGVTTLKMGLRGESPTVFRNQKIFIMVHPNKRSRTFHHYVEYLNESLEWQPMQWPLFRIEWLVGYEWREGKFGE